MTDLDLSLIPQDINTVERLAAYACTLLHVLNPTKAIIENAGENPEQVAQFFALRADDGSLRHIFRLSLPVDPTIFANSQDPSWTSTLDLSNTDIPAAFLNN